MPILAESIVASPIYAFIASITLVDILSADKFPIFALSIVAFDAFKFIAVIALAFITSAIKLPVLIFSASKSVICAFPTTKSFATILAISATSIFALSIVASSMDAFIASITTAFILSAVIAFASILSAVIQLAVKLSAVILPASISLAFIELINAVFAVWLIDLFPVDPTLLFVLGTFALILEISPPLKLSLWTPIGIDLKTLFLSVSFMISPHSKCGIPCTFKSYDG